MPMPWVSIAHFDDVYRARDSAAQILNIQINSIFVTISHRLPTYKIHREAVKPPVILLAAVAKRNVEQGKAPEETVPTGLVYIKQRR